MIKNTDDVDKIVKTIVLRASRERVWQTITDSSRFGLWFGVELDGPFVAGEEVTGRILPTQVDPEIASLQEPYRGLPWRIKVERIEPMSLFSFSWHPYAVDPAVDLSEEPMTLVTFELQEVEDGILLKITETGFDQLAPNRRAEALKANEGGWELQTLLIEKYLAKD